MNLNENNFSAVGNFRRFAGLPLDPWNEYPWSRCINDVAAKAPLAGHMHNLIHPLSHKFDWNELRE